MADQIPDSAKTTQIYVRWSVDGQFIRKWSREPFADGEPVDAVADPPAMDREAVERETFERCAKICDELAQKRRGMMHPADHPLSGGIVDGMAERAASSFEFAAASIRALSTLSADAIRQGEGENWLPITDDAKSGALVELVVEYREGDHPLVDAVRACTIGFNTLADTGIDEWKFAGWCWTHDHFVQGKGTPVAWRPSRLNAADGDLPPLPATPASHASDGGEGA